MSRKSIVMLTGLVVVGSAACAAPIDPGTSAEAIVEGETVSFVECPSCVRLDRAVVLSSGALDTTDEYVVDPWSGVHGTVESIALLPGMDLRAEVDFTRCSTVDLCPLTPGLRADAPIVDASVDSTTLRIDVPIAGRITGPSADVRTCVTIRLIPVDDGFGIGFERSASVATPDLNANGVVNPSDLSVFLSLWAGGTDARGDLDGTGVVNPADLSLWLSFSNRGGSVEPCPLARCFADEDEDGFPTTEHVLVPSTDPCPSGTMTEQRPDGLVDCADYEADAHPGATAYRTWFYDTEAGPSFDYDCDGIATREHPSFAFPFCAPGYPSGAGWLDTIPTCGEPGRFVPACGASPTIRTQACR